MNTFDVMKAIDDLRAKLWAEYGDVLVTPRSQEEIHMTYYVSHLLEHRGHAWFKSPDVAGACYTERAMQDAFTAGRRIGRKEGLAQVDDLVRDRIAAAHAALDGEGENG